MKITDLFEREKDISKLGYGPRRKQLIGAIAQSTHEPSLLKNPNYIMTVAKSFLSNPPYSDWSEREQRRMLADIMDAFGMMPPDQNTAVFKR